MPFDDLKITGDGVPSLPGGRSGLGKEEVGTMPLNFETVKMLSLRTCLQCHAGGNLNMISPQVVVEKRDRILEEINFGLMPPATSGLRPINACELQILETWIEDQVAGRETSQKVSDLSHCGDFKTEPEKPPVDLSKLEPTYENVKEHIFAVKCLTCHNTQTAKGKTNLDNMEAILAKGNLITAQPEDSKIIQRVLLRGRGQMPTQKSGIPVLTSEQVDFLRRWILNSQPTSN